MVSIHAPRSALRLCTLFGGAALLLLPGCPGDVTPIDDTGSSSGSSTTTNPPDTTTLDSGCEGTGGCGQNDTTESSNGSTSTGPGNTDSTGPGTSSTDGTGSTGSTGSTSSTSTGESSSSSTTEGVSATGSSSSGEFETGVVFIIEPDVPGGMECSPWLQDCPVGEKCNAWDSSGGGSWDGNACFPIDPDPVGVGETCTVQGSETSGIDNCELGAMCWNVDNMTNEGTCVALCTGTPADPVCAAGTTCAITNGGVLTLCLPGCDPLLQDCDPGQACYPVGEDFTCAPDASGAAGIDGDGCEFINVCDPGLMCVFAGAVEGCFGFAGCCTPFCDVSMGGDPCPALSEECVPFYEPGLAPPGLEDVGVCSIPA
jgi:hypothetical protein